MLFTFLKYTSPTWNFNLKPVGSLPYFPDLDKLDAIQRSLLELDYGYSSRDVVKLDAAYQAWNKGIIESDPDFALQYQMIKPDISDNYRFLRRYFNPLWSWYVLSIRILTFHNPIEELAGFFTNFRVSRLKLFEKIYPHKLEGLNQSVISPSFNLPTANAHPPKVSVIIPTLNRYEYLKDALCDLEKQDYQNFEVIIVDQSDPYHPEFFESFKLKITLIRQEEKALWLARNTAVQISDAEFILLYDDDSRTAKDWISQHMQCLHYFDADISSGVSISVVGSKVPANYSFFRWGDQLDTGNAMVRRRVFRRIGLFDRQFEGQRMGDGEFGLRAYLQGFKNISNPLAKRLHLKAGEGGLRQMGSWDAFRPKSLFAPRPVPSVLYLYRKYFGNQAAMLSIIQNLMFSVIPYRKKGKKIAILMYLPFMVLALPILIINGRISWNISGKMIKEGNKISLLK